MTVKMEASKGGIPHQKLLIGGLVTAVVCIYLTYLNQVLHVGYFAFFGGIAAVAALWWGSDTIKHLCSYGLGTGVPSAGMIAFGTGAIAMIVATKFGLASPVMAVIIAAIIGAIIGYIANEIINMNIPVMVISLTELAIVGSLTMLGFASMICGSFLFEDLIGNGAVIKAVGLSGILPQYGLIFTNIDASGTVIGGCVLAVAFMLGAIALQHPFNACLGPNESQDRTLMLALECGFLSMIAISVISFAFLDIVAATLSLVISLIGFGYTMNQYLKLSKRDAFMWLDAKPIREVGGEK